MGNRRKSTTNFGGTRKRGTPSRRPSLPQMLARMSTRECARRAAHAGKLKDALARLRAELQEINADVTTVQVTCTADGETTNLGVDDAPLPFPVSPTSMHPQSPVLSTSLPSTSSISSSLGKNNQMIGGLVVPPGSSGQHSKMADIHTYMRDDAPPGFGPPPSFNQIQSAPVRDRQPVHPTPTLLPAVPVPQEDTRRTSLPCGTYSRESRNSLSSSIRTIRDAQTAYARELYASRTAPKYVPASVQAQPSGCTSGRNHFISSTASTGGTARVPSPSGPHIPSFTPTSAANVSSQPSNASSSSLFGIGNRKPKNTTMQLPILSAIPTCIVGTPGNALPSRNNRNRTPLQQKCPPQETHPGPPPRATVTSSYADSIPKVIVGSIPTQAVPTVISGPHPSLNAATSSARRSFGRDGGMNPRRSFGRLPIFTRSTSVASSSSNTQPVPVHVPIPILSPAIETPASPSDSSSEDSDTVSSSSQYQQPPSTHIIVDSSISYVPLSSD